MSHFHSRVTERVWPRQILLCVLALISLRVPAVCGQDSACAFDTSIQSFTGSPVEQARCLLRPVNPYAHIGPLPARLPDPLEALIGQPVSFSATAVRTYLATRSIREQDLGGSLTGTVSPSDSLDPKAGVARYFVIHDTSSPNYLNSPFPTNIDSAYWPHNRLAPYGRGNAAKRTHVYVNRAGESITATDFAQALPGSNYGTKFARDLLGQRFKGVMLHVELIQPRRRDPNGGRLNDALAPVPGFSDAQLDRLALVYVAASVRAGRWLIPAFHAVVDVGLQDAHDDPQGFDLVRWASRLKSIVDAIDVLEASGLGVSPLNAVVPLKADGFGFPEPTLRGSRLELWATYYHVYDGVQSIPGGVPLLDLTGRSLGPLLSLDDWCRGAVEGTIRVTESTGEAKVYNYAGRGTVRQVDCSSVLRNPILNLNAIGSTRFGAARGPYGDGVPGMILVPLRTIAVDKRILPYGTVVYIPGARGKQVVLPSGQTVTHDGYFLAADTGGAIVGTHIDVFGGTSRANPFPGFVKSRPMDTFEAFVIDDPAIKTELVRLHTP